jgi:hypothetical protein
MKKIHILETDTLMSALKKISEKEGHIFTCVIEGIPIFTTSQTTLLILKNHIKKFKKQIIIESNHKRVIENMIEAGFDIKQCDKKRAEEETEHIPFWQKIRQKISDEMFENHVGQSPVLLKKMGNKALVAIISIIALVGSFVVYLAVPDATIYITPNINIHNIRNNIYFGISGKEYLNTENKEETEYLIPETKKIVPLYPIKIEINEKITLDSTGKTSLGKKASGTIQITSSAPFSFRFKPGTRFQTNTGIVFRSESWIDIPKNGKVEIKVIADIFDVQSQYIGTRGNISKGTLIVLPGLKNTSKYIKASAKNNFLGGTTHIEKYINEEDIQTAEIKIKKHLEKLTDTYIQRYIFTHFADKKNIHTFTNVYQDILLQKEFKNIVIHANTNEKKDTFSAEGTLSIQTYAYDLKELKAQFEDFAQTHTIIGEKFVKIEKDSLEFENILNWNKKEELLKVTVLGRAITKYSLFDDNKEIIDMLRRNIAGMKKNKAEFFINNRPEVADVDIFLFPFWLHALPNITKNIHFKIIES